MTSNKKSIKFFFFFIGIASSKLLFLFHYKIAWTCVNLYDVTFMQMTQCEHVNAFAKKNVANLIERVIWLMEYWHCIHHSLPLFDKTFDDDLSDEIFVTMCIYKYADY